MSYARVSEGSDVYVVRTGTHVTCYCGDEGGQDRDEQGMLDHLLGHLVAGEKVPQRALDRLRAERDGIPYETDVQRAIRELQEEP